MKFAYSLMNSPSRILHITTLIIAMYMHGFIAYAETATHEEENDLQTLELFHSTQLELAREPLDTIRTQYKAALEEYRQKAQDDGKLKAVLAAREALASFESGGAAAGSDDTGVAELGKSFLAKKAETEATLQQITLKIDQQYRERLAALVVKLTKAGKIEAAEAVQEKVDELSEPSGASLAVEQPESETTEEWKQKAIAEYPELADPKSNLSIRIMAKVKSLKISNPAYFSNSQWPYLIAKEVKSELNLADSVIISKYHEILEILPNNLRLKGGRPWTKGEMNAANKIFEIRLRLRPYLLKFPAKIENPGGINTPLVASIPNDEGHPIHISARIAPNWVPNREPLPLKPVEIHANIASARYVWQYGRNMLIIGAENATWTESDNTK